MKASTLANRNRFNQKKRTTRFKNWAVIQREIFQLNRCAWCLKPLHGEVHIDHVYPLSHSKNKRINNYNNLVYSCKICNKLKGDRTDLCYPEWILRRKRNMSGKDFRELLETAKQQRLKHG